MSWLLDLLNNGGNNPVTAEAIRLAFLENCDYNTVDFFSLNGMEGWAKVVKVYDGDTMTVVFFINEKPFKFRIRLADIDTAEKTSSCKEEVQWSNMAIDWCKDFIGDKGLVYLSCKRFDKYGRVLANVYKCRDKRCCLNTILLGAGLAYEYDGTGKRLPFKEWAKGIDTSDPPTLKEYIGDSEVLDFYK